MEVDVVVEIPQGERNKYEIDHETGRIRLDRTLFTATRYPAEYGFIEHTHALDGDPLDALVLMGEPTFPGCVINGRVIGMFCMTDENGEDNKIICVPAGDPRWDAVKDIDDIADYHRLELQHFFEVYKQLEPDKEVSDPSWADAAAAQREITESQQRYGAEHKSS
jgi:inorganic pyrophosphatase